MTDIEVLDTRAGVATIACAGCGQPFAEISSGMPVGDALWHERCLLLQAFTTLAALDRAPRALMTAKQVGDRLGESSSSVLRRKETIGYVRLRRAGVADEDAPVRFRPEDVERYIVANHEAQDEELPVSRRRHQPRTPLAEQHRHLRPRRERAG